MKVNFEAEVIEVKARKTASGDKEFRITLVTDNADVVIIEQAIANYPVKVDLQESA
jgi:hypothetical protein